MSKNNVLYFDKYGDEIDSVIIKDNKDNYNIVYIDESNINKFDEDKSIAFKIYEIIKEFKTSGNYKIFETFETYIKNIDEVDKLLFIKSLIPYSKESQYIGKYKIEGGAVQCTFIAYYAIEILERYKSFFYHIPDNINNFTTIRESSTNDQSDIIEIWEEILKTGKSKFLSDNCKNAKDPLDLDKEQKKILDSTYPLNNDYGLEYDKFIININKYDFCLLNKAGQTVLLFNLNNNYFILVDSHNRNGLYLLNINDVKKYILKLYDYDEPAFANFPKKKIL